ncbi:MAG: ribonuclease H [Bacteroidaceae bacterium]|nr:ribonuclease H [Bacteroidaceae bacterium]
MTARPPLNDTSLNRMTPAEIKRAIAVDAACSGNPGPMEYRGVLLPEGREIFHFGPIQGTNNIGEFLAIVHALALQWQHKTSLPIYTDSRTALAWLRKRKSGTKLAATPQTARALELVERAEKWLATHDYSHISILKWETELWGEVPADFGRKK